MADYSLMTQEEFNALLETIVGELSAAQILAYGDVNMILREELNNEILERWEEENPEKAYPHE